MSKNTKDSEQIAPTGSDKIISTNIVTEMKDSYLADAMSVITSRALPVVRGVLISCRRGLLYTMLRLGISS